MIESDLDTALELAMMANPYSTKERYRQHLIERLRENSDLCFVAAKNGKVIGYASGEIKSGELGILEDIAVFEDQQHKGVGELLLETVLKALKKKGVKVVVAEVHYKCASAVPFYYKHGFRISGFMGNYFGIGHDTLLLELVL